MNNLPFDFEKEQPPILSESMLKKEKNRRMLIKQIRLLKISAFLFAFCIALFALFIVQKSLFACIFAITVLFVYLSGYGVLSVLFFAKGYSGKI